MARNWQAALAAALVVVGVAVSYAPALFAEYGIADDYPCLQDAAAGPEWMIPAMKRLGRPAGAYALFYSYRAAGTIANLRWLRALSLAGIAVLALLLFAELRRRSQPPFVAASIAVLAATLPAFQIYAAWAQVWHYSFACALTYLSFRLTGSASAVRVAAAAVALWLALALYQPAAMFFFVWMALDVWFLGGRPLAAIPWARRLGAFFAALFLYFAVFRLSGTAAPRAQLATDLWAKARWFGLEVLPQALRLSWIESHGAFPPAMAASAIVAGAVAFARGSFSRRMTILTTLGALALLSYLPNLAAAEIASPLRTMAALSAILALLFWLSAAALASIAVRRGGVILSIAAATVSVWHSRDIEIHTLIEPRARELKLLRAKLRGWNAGYPRIEVVQRSDGAAHTDGPYAREFAGGTFELPLAWDVARWMTVLCAREISPRATFGVNVSSAGHSPPPSPGVWRIDVTAP